MAAAPRKKEILRAFDKFLEDGSYEATVRELFGLNRS